MIPSFRLGRFQRHAAAAALAAILRREGDETSPLPDTLQRRLGEVREMQALLKDGGEILEAHRSLLAGCCAYMAVHLGRNELHDLAQELRREYRVSRGEASVRLHAPSPASAAVRAAPLLGIEAETAVQVGHVHWEVFITREGVGTFGYQDTLTVEAVV
ncbi:hypothetical protein [Deinococcus murrayi]|uniref:hypothetical protein n=1 Tax=Deinococcus murrayi TaxID=68910 RepID=UPI0004845A1D|nr:hypothetical protein [Deinococcus murrayi]